MSVIGRWSGPAAAIVFVAALLGFGLALPGYSQIAHPVAVLGAKGVPHATGFNLLVFALMWGWLCEYAATAVLYWRDRR